MLELPKLRHDHAQLIEIVTRLSKVIAKPHPPSASELLKLRHELTSTLIFHLKLEDWVLYPRLFASREEKVARTARKFSAEMGGLAQTYTAHADKWTATTIEQDWRGYCGETQAVIEELTCRIERENRELYPLLEAMEKAA